MEACLLASQSEMKADIIMKLSAIIGGMITAAISHSKAVVVTRQKTSDSMSATLKKYQKTVK